MLQVETAVLLDDFRAIKLPGNVRKQVDAIRKMLQENGDIPLEKKRQVRDIARRYKKQLNMLRESRERGRKTLALKKLGIKRSEAEALAKEREAQKDAERNDMGF